MPDEPRKAKLEVVHELDATTTDPTMILNRDIAVEFEHVIVEKFSDKIAMCEISASRVGPVCFITAKFVSQEEYDKLYKRLDEMLNITHPRPPAPPSSVN